MGFFFLLCAGAGAFLLGAIPTAYWLGKWRKGVDLREHGSGNVGATNAFRVMGKLAGLFVLIVDAGKGALSVTLLPQIVKQVSPIEDAWLTAILGVSVIAGHVWTPFLKFQGGKGVATSLGVFLCLAPFSALTALGVWIASLVAFRYISVSSMLAAFMLPLAMAISLKPFPFVLAASVACLVICYRHRPNVHRLLVGSENRLGRKA